MKLIYKGEPIWPFEWEETNNGTIVVEHIGNIKWGDAGLIVDPTDEQWDAAIRGKPIPVTAEDIVGHDGNGHDNLWNVVGDYRRRRDESASVRKESQ